MQEPKAAAPSTDASVSLLFPNVFQNFPYLRPYGSHFLAGGPIGNVLATPMKALEEALEYHQAEVTLGSIDRKRATKAGSASVLTEKELAEAKSELSVVAFPFGIVLHEFGEMSSKWNFSNDSAAPPRLLESATSFIRSIARITTAANADAGRMKKNRQHRANRSSKLGSQDSGPRMTAGDGIRNDWEEAFDAVENSNYEWLCSAGKLIQDFQCLKIDSIHAAISVPDNEKTFVAQELLEFFPVIIVRTTETVHVMSATDGLGQNLSMVLLPYACADDDDDDTEITVIQTDAPAAAGRKQPQHRILEKFPELPDIIKNIIESRSASVTNKDRRVVRGIQPLNVVGITMPELSATLQRDHGVKISKSVLRRMLKAPVRGSISANRYSELVEAKPATHLKVDTVSHTRQHSSSSNVRFAIEYLRSKSAAGHSAVMISCDDYKSVPLIIDASSATPRGVVLQGMDPLHYDHDFVVGSRLLIRTSGYVLSSFNASDVEMADDSEKTEVECKPSPLPNPDARHKAPPPSRRIHTYVRTFDTPCSSNAHICDLYDVIKSLKNPPEYVLVVSDNGGGYNPNNTLTQLHVAKMMTHFPEIKGIMWRTYAPYSSRFNNKIERSWSYFSLGLAGIRLASSLAGELASAKGREKDGVIEKIKSLGRDEASDLFCKLNVEGMRVISTPILPTDHPVIDEVPLRELSTSLTHQKVFQSTAYPEWEQIRHLVRNEYPGCCDFFREPISLPYAEPADLSAIDNRISKLGSKKRPCTDPEPSDSKRQKTVGSDIVCADIVPVSVPSAVVATICAGAENKADEEPDQPCIPGTDVGKVGDTYTIFTTDEHDQYLTYYEFLERYGSVEGVQNKIVIPKAGRRERLQVCIRCAPERIHVGRYQASILRHHRLFHTDPRKNHMKEKHQHHEHQEEPANEYQLVAMDQ